MAATVLFTLGAALLVARLVVLARLHAVSTRHVVREAVSDYGVGPTRRLFAVMGWLAAGAWAALAGATWLGLPGRPDRTLVTVTLAGVALVTALLPLFPTDLEGQRLTATGAVHYLLAIVGFGLAYSVMGNLSRLLGDPLAAGLQWLALASLVALCVCLVPRLRRWFGLCERVYIVAVALFYLRYAVAGALGLG